MKSSIFLLLLGASLSGLTDPLRGAEPVGLRLKGVLLSVAQATEEEVDSIKRAGGNAVAIDLSEGQGGSLAEVGRRIKQVEGAGGGGYLVSRVKLDQGWEPRMFKWREREQSDR